MIYWKSLDESGFETSLKETSTEGYILVFKHSPTCSISQMAKLRLESQWSDGEAIETYLVDVKSSKLISQSISEIFEVHHESPQVLLLKDGICIYDASHFDISVAEIHEAIAWHEKQ